MDFGTLDTVGRTAGAVAGGGAVGAGLLAWALKRLWRRQEEDIREVDRKVQALHDRFDEDQKERSQATGEIKGAIGEIRGVLNVLVGQRVVGEK